MVSDARPWLDGMVSGRAAMWDIDDLKNPGSNLYPLVAPGTISEDMVQLDAIMEKLKFLRDIHHL